MLLLLAGVACDCHPVPSGAQEDTSLAGEHFTCTHQAAPPIQVHQHVGALDCKQRAGAFLAHFTCSAPWLLAFGIK